MDGDAIWITVQGVKTSLSSLSSLHSESQKDVDHIRYDIGLVLGNVPHSLTWTQMSLFQERTGNGEQAMISGEKAMENKQ